MAGTCCSCHQPALSLHRIHSLGSLQTYYQVDRPHTHQPVENEAAAECIEGQEHGTLAAVFVSADPAEPLFELPLPPAPGFLRRHVLEALCSSSSAPLFSASSSRANGRVYWVAHTDAQANDRAVRVTGITDIRGDAVVVPKLRQELTLHSGRIPRRPTAAEGTERPHAESLKALHHGAPGGALACSGELAAEGLPGSLAPLPGTPGSEPAGGVAPGWSLDMVPSGVLQTVFSSLGFADLTACAAVCHLWRQALAEDEFLLSKLAIRRKTFRLPRKMATLVAPARRRLGGGGPAGRYPARRSAQSTAARTLDDAPAASLPRQAGEGAMCAATEPGYVSYGGAIAAGADSAPPLQGQGAAQSAEWGPASVASSGRRGRTAGAATISLPFVLRRAAEVGNVEAMVLVGEELEARNEFSLALDWYRKAARHGHQRSQYRIGDAYYRGQGDWPRDEEEALAWLLRAVKNPAADRFPCGASALLLGYMYLDGEGTHRADNTEAVKWFKASRDYGCKEAEKTVGWLWNTGQY